MDCEIVLRPGCSLILFPRRQSWRTVAELPRTEKINNEAEKSEPELDDEPCTFVPVSHEVARLPHAELQHNVWHGPGLYKSEGIGQCILAPQSPGGVTAVLQRKDNFEWVVPEHLKACRPVASNPELSFHYGTSSGPIMGEAVAQVGHLLAFSFSSDLQSPWSESLRLII